MSRTHSYTTLVTWTGNQGTGTSGYRAYTRDHQVEAPGRPVILGSSDPMFRGDPERWNPELLLVASLSQCHMLWYLHLCSDAKVVVTGYVDEALGTLVEDPGAAGRFTSVTLRPQVTVTEASMMETAQGLHARANELCYVAQSVNFPVHHEPTVFVG